MSANHATELVTDDEGSDSGFDLDRIEAVAARLDLRQPNKEALESIVFEVVQHYEIDRKEPPFEAVVDSATGVGKTYILAAAMEYFASEGVRDFAVITPGRTILDKTVANFTPGHPKSSAGRDERRAGRHHVGELQHRRDARGDGRRRSRSSSTSSRSSR